MYLRELLNQLIELLEHIEYAGADTVTPEDMVALLSKISIAGNAISQGHTVSFLMGLPLYTNSLPLDHQINYVNNYWSAIVQYLN